jgi:hemin uptake protein HemP
MADLSLEMIYVTGYNEEIWEINMNKQYKAHTSKTVFNGLNVLLIVHDSTIYQYSETNVMHF